MSDSTEMKYPLLQEVLADNLSLQPMYTNRDVARIFKVCVRAIQNWITPLASWFRRTFRDGGGSCRKISKTSSNPAEETAASRPLRGFLKPTSRKSLMRRCADGFYRKPYIRWRFARTSINSQPFADLHQDSRNIRKYGGRFDSN